MADLGAIGRSVSGAAGPEPTLASGPSAFWFDPANRAVVMRNDGIRGPEPMRLGAANGTVPVDEVTVIVANYGQSGGGVTIFG